MVIFDAIAVVVNDTNGKGLGVVPGEKSCVKCYGEEKKGYTESEGSRLCPSSTAFVPKHASRGPGNGVTKKVRLHSSPSMPLHVGG